MDHKREEGHEGQMEEERGTVGGSQTRSKKAGNKCGLGWCWLSS